MVIMVQDIRVTDCRDLEIYSHDWTMKGTSQRGAAGGVAMAVPKGKEVEVVDVQIGESQIVKMEIDGRRFIIANTYIRPGEEVNK